MERLDRCAACKSRLNPNIDTTDIPLDVQDQMQAYCKTCAYETMGIDVKLPEQGTFQHGCGGGRRVIKSTKSFS